MSAERGAELLLAYMRMGALGSDPEALCDLADLVASVGVKMDGTEAPRAEWAVVELMGHVRLAGRVTEEEKFGGKLGRVDVPAPDGSFATNYFSHAAIYRVTPVSERDARAVAAGCFAAPVTEWDHERAARALAARNPRVAPTADVYGDRDDDTLDDDDRPF